MQNSKWWSNDRVYLAVDAIILNDKGEILLIERKNPPDGWALPGGFVDPGESVETALAREVAEETTLQVSSARQFHCYSDPGRDPRGIYVASVVFEVKATGVPVGSDDAKKARFFSRESLPELAFDHKQILDDYFNRKYPVGLYL